jgi:hypothetical protein
MQGELSHGRAAIDRCSKFSVEGNGMTPIEEPDLGRILSYLATHYGVDRPNFPKP